MSSYSTPPGQTGQPQIDRLDAILLGKDNEACSIVRAIEVYLKIFHLETNYPASDILARVYLITERKLKSGTEIHNLGAWFKRTSFNVIRDIHKEERRAAKKPRKLVERGFNATQKPESNDIDHVENTQVAALYKAIATLSQRDQAILELRFKEELSWEEIVDRMNFPSNEAARQAGSRALARVRRSFFDICDVPNTGGES